MKPNFSTNLNAAPTEDTFGFFGTVKDNENITEAQACNAWKAAMKAITMLTNGNAILARNFLRHRMGRHFADATTFHKGTLAKRIEATALEKWVVKEIAALAKDGFDKELFEDDSAA